MSDKHDDSWSGRGPWPENVVDNVVITRGDKFITRPPTQRELVKTAESAYRRGYQQGAHYAHALAVAGMSLEELDRWIGYDLHDWRYSKDRVNGTPPPEPQWVRRKRK